MDSSLRLRMTLLSQSNHSIFMYISYLLKLCHTSEVWHSFALEHASRFLEEGHGVPCPYNCFLRIYTIFN